MTALTPGDVYALPDGTIIRVDYDHDAECPMAMTGTPVYAYRGPRLSYSTYAAAPEDEVLRVFAEYYDRHDDAEAAVTLAQRYARAYAPELLGDADKLRLGHWRGYSQGDWLDYAYVSEYDLSGEFELYLQGDVSFVTIERPGEDPEYLSGISRPYGEVHAEDLGLDLTGVRLAIKTITYH